MIEEKYYDAILWAKSAIADMVKDSDEFEISMGEYLSDSQTAAKAANIVSRWILAQPSIIARVALATVLTTGAFDENTGCFYMPATGDCCRNFRKVRQILKHHKPISTLVYGFNYTDYKDPEDWVVRFM